MVICVTLMLIISVDTSEYWILQKCCLQKL
jgi:hypothetical protein